MQANAPRCEHKCRRMHPWTQLCFSKRTFVFSNAVRSFQTQAQMCHDHNARQEQFSKIYCSYRKSVQKLINVVSSQTLKLWQASVISPDKFSAANPETNFRFFNLMVFTNLRITFDLVLNKSTQFCLIANWNFDSWKILLTCLYNFFGMVNNTQPQNWLMLMFMNLMGWKTFFFKKYRTSNRLYVHCLRYLWLYVHCLRYLWLYIHCLFCGCSHLILSF